MKSRLVLFAAVSAFIAICCNIAHSPPSFVDAITGAAPKSWKKAGAVQSAPALYALYKNEGVSFSPGSAWQLAIVKDDEFLASSANILSDDLKLNGVTLEIEAYSEILLVSRAVAGKYELILIDAERTVMPELPGAERSTLRNGSREECP
ncbi:MAG: hypothetical protein LBU32_26730 [Clostridiales bacterium]|jgi:hypothetical protein|nr:hypothetical protein [Clostridiales bacterium]